jgi:peptidyl-tRNA hydrolase, PTH1 family
MVTPILPLRPTAIVGLGNPEPKFARTRHNVGFQIIDALAEKHGGQWHPRHVEEVAHIVINGAKILLVKSQTYMNNSGDIVPYLKKEGIKPLDALVIHDELELPFGKISIKRGGSAKGHNGLKSVMEKWGTDEFARLRFGIGRPDDKEHVPDYVLHNFENQAEAQRLIQESVAMIEQLYA